MIEINVDCLLKQRKKRRRLLEQREARAIMTIELLTKQITPIAANSHPIRIRFASNSQPISNQFPTNSHHFDCANIQTPIFRRLLEPAVRSGRTANCADLFRIANLKPISLIFSSREISERFLLFTVLVVFFSISSFRLGQTHLFDEKIRTPRLGRALHQSVASPLASHSLVSSALNAAKASP